MLEAGFYRRNADVVARELLGKHLVRTLPGGVIRARIVECEAYGGADDRASHARGGLKSPRNRSMYLEGGHAYVFLIYGLHVCFNVVCSVRGDPQAVLIRALEPLSGLDLIRKNRPVRDGGPFRLTNGPGKLTAALAIDRSFDGWDLTGGGRLRLERGDRPERILQSPRINVDYAGPDAKRLWRYYLEGNPYVSRT